MNNNQEKPDSFFGKLEEQMAGAKGGDGLTDSERQAIKRGVGKDDKEALAALARQRQEIISEQNPSGLPLIFRKGNEIKVRRSVGILEDGWRVSRYDRAGYVIVEKRDAANPKGLEKTLTFKEFYKLNPPDEKCMNAEYLEEYKKDLK